MSSSETEMTARPCRLILLTQWFDPEPTFKGLLFARELHARGFNVEVVTGFPNYPGGRLYPGYRLRPIQREAIDGVSITRLLLYPSHGQNAFGRIINYVSFFFAAAIYLIFAARRADILYAYHPPLTVSLAAALAKLFRRTPIVMDIQDLWPDSLGATGMMKASGPLKIIGWLCRKVYASAAHIVVLSPGFKKMLIRRGVPEVKISVVYNWADERAINQVFEDRPSAMNSEGRFRILFAGNMGLAQDLDMILNAAKIVAKENDRIEFCFLGDGLASAGLKQRVKDESIPNVLFLPKVPMSQVGAYLQAADVLLVSLRPDPLFEITIPSKTQAYMSVGKPVIMAVGGDAANLVKDAGAGIVTKPGDPKDLARATLELAQTTPSLIRKMGSAGQLYYRDHLSTSQGVEAFVRIFENNRRR